KASGDYLSVFNRSASILSVIAWPVVLASQRYLGRLATIAILVATIFIINRLNSSAPIMAVMLALSVFLAAIFWRRTTAVSLAGIILVLTLAAPAIPLVTPLFDRVLNSVNVVDAGINHRLRIWDYVAGRSHQRPLTGWGLDASRNLAGDNDRVTIKTTVQGATTAAEVVPLHPHNAALQIWVELGLPGALLAVLLLLWAIRSVLTRIPGKPETAICLAAIASATVGAALSFGIWQGWWQATLWLTAALTLALAHPTPQRGS
ncbi:MAG: O-antigen ligase family protein, partial [Alphaproteobacteria bacterium]